MSDPTPPGPPREGEALTAVIARALREADGPGTDPAWYDFAAKRVAAATTARLAATTGAEITGLFDAYDAAIERYWHCSADADPLVHEREARRMRDSLLTAFAALQQRAEEAEAVAQRRAVERIDRAADANDELITSWREKCTEARRAAREECAQVADSYEGAIGAAIRAL